MWDYNDVVVKGVVVLVHPVCVMHRDSSRALLLLLLLLLLAAVMHNYDTPHAYVVPDAAGIHSIVGFPQKSPMFTYLIILILIIHL